MARAHLNRRTLRIFHVGHTEGRRSDCNAALMQTRDDMQTQICSFEFFLVSLWKDATTTREHTRECSHFNNKRSPFMLARSQCLFLTHTSQDWGREQEVHKHAFLTSHNHHSQSTTSPSSWISAHTVSRAESISSYIYKTISRLLPEGVSGKSTPNTALASSYRERQREGVVMMLADS